MGVRFRANESCNTHPPRFHVATNRQYVWLDFSALTSLYRSGPLAHTFLRAEVVQTSNNIMSFSPSPAHSLSVSVRDDGGARWNNGRGGREARERGATASSSSSHGPFEIGCWSCPLRSPAAVERGRESERGKERRERGNLIPFNCRFCSRSRSTRRWGGRRQSAGERANVRGYYRKTVKAMDLPSGRD